MFLAILYNFSLLFSKSVPTIFVTSKKGPRPKWTIFKPESDKNQNCLSVSYSGILSVFVCSAFTAYSSLCRCRGLKYLLKKYRISSKIILTWPDFWFSRLFVWACRKHCPMFEKNITKINVICVWLNISSPNFHRLYV